MTPAELVAATASAMNGLGAKYYFDPRALAKGKEAGLDGFRLYILGRGGVLGNCEAPVVASAFGYFAPPLVARMWDSAREIVAPRDAARLYLDANAEIGRAALGTVDEATLAGFCDAAEQVVADVNPAGLALFAGYAAEPLPDDAPARALQLCIVHRELRGDAHLAAIIAAGVHPADAHAFRRPSDVESFGWPADTTPADGTADAMAAIDRTTDELSAGHYASLTDAQRQAFAAGVAAMTSAFEAAESS